MIFDGVLDVARKRHFLVYQDIIYICNYTATVTFLFQVASDPFAAWGSAIWYWKMNVHTAPGVTDGHFGATTNALNGAVECRDDDHIPMAKKRFEIYKSVLKAFHLKDTPAIEEGCYS